MKKIKSLLSLTILSSCALYAFNADILNSELVTKTNVIEPSALSFSLDKKSLLTVSDNNSSLYQISFDGKVLKEIKTLSRDLEGITTHNDLKGYCVVEERIRNIVCLDQSGSEVKRKSINFSGESNSGFEGITYNPKNKHFYVVNEKKPVSIIELDNDLNILNTMSFNHAKDLSDIFYDESNNVFWLLSHESKEIYMVDDKFNILKTYSIPNVVQAEGIAVDSYNKKIYIISDKDSNFYIFKY